MTISAVVLSFNSEKTIRRCLESLIMALDLVDGANEVFVVDNGSSDGSASIIKHFEELRPELVRAIFLQQNAGTTRARNIALEKASGDDILILDSDAYIDGQALLSLVNFLNANPGTGVAAPRLVYGNGNFQMSCDTFPTLGRKVRRYFFLRNLEAGENDLRNAKQPVDVDYAISACWLISRAALDAVGFLDERIFYSPEDVDYCLRMWEKGFRVTYVPEVQVIHDAQELSRGFRLSRFHFSHLKGLLYLFRKHRYCWGLTGLHRRIGRFR